MLFDKTREEILSDDEAARARRIREEQAARERLQQEIEDGRRLRQERREVAKRFIEKTHDGSPAGRAKAAIESGSTVFQLVLPLALDAGGGEDTGADHNPILNTIEAQGWRLAQASYVARSAAPSSDAAPAAGAAGGLVAVYIFRRSI